MTDAEAIILGKLVISAGYKLCLDDAQRYIRDFWTEANYDIYVRNLKDTARWHQLLAGWIAYRKAGGA